MATFVGFIFLTALSLASGDADIIFPKTYGQQQLATRIHCQVEETQHFLYSSATKLWGSVGGDVVVTADVKLHCLGVDENGKYKSEALKYLAEVSNLIIEQKNISHEDPLLRRSKRGIGDFFSDAWTKVKKFFTRMFGGKPDPPIHQAPPDHTATGDGRIDVEEEEDVPESTAEDLRHLYAVPFQFVQLANGSIPEIRFAENEVEDGRIRNFKRHLVDAFATQLNFDQKQKDIVETTVTGEHLSSYKIDVSGESTTVNLAGFSLHKQKDEEPTVTVNKMVTGDKIHRLAPSEAANDRERMQLNLQQMQVYKGGKLLSSSGTSSVVLLPETPRKRRKKRENEDDLTSNFHAHSAFSIQLQKRKRRSAEESARVGLHENLTFRPASRLAEKEDSSDRHKIRLLQKSFGDKTRLFQNLIDAQEEDYDEKMQIISEVLQKEVELKLDDEPQSVANVVRNILTKDMLYLMCNNNFTVCKDFLQLLAVAGGPEAETVFLSLLSNKDAFTPLQSRVIASSVTDFSNPSTNFLNALVRFITERQQEPAVLGSISLSCGSLGSKSDPKTKSKISQTFIKLLEENGNKCDQHDFLLDILEAVGNLDCEKTIPFVLQVSRNCQQSSAIQIACAHALRHHSDLPSVSMWMHSMTSHSDCEVVRAVVGALMDKIQDQYMVGDVSNWPRNGFNQVDENLKRHLSSSLCPVEDTIIYFSKKKNAVANEIAHNYYGAETEPWNPVSQSRQKRALWDNMNCNEWTADDKFRPIQGKEEFEADKALYNKRKSCLAFRRLGVKGANAEIYAGMFAGVKEPSEPLKYKLFTKFVSSLNFLGSQMEIGSFYFYHNSGNTKAYVRILGQTRQELTHEGCTPMDLKYRPVRHIPLYQVNIFVVQLSLGIHLSSQLALDTDCPGTNQYMMEPLTNVRIGGEAVGTVGLARGSFNVGGNFNYKLQFTFTPTPNMCLKGNHGYDPMSISFETYYQLWNVLKNDWGKARFWRPSFLSWDISKGSLKPWFDDTCIRTEDNPPSINLEREIE